MSNMFERGNSDEQLEQAQSFVETQRYSGLVRHYSVEAVRDNIEQFTGVHVTEGQAKTIVNTVRSQNGWGPASHL